MDQNVIAAVSYGLKLCTRFFPCSMQIKGDSDGVIQRKENGYISCLSSDGCETLRLERIKFVCESTKHHNSAIRIQGSYLVISNSSFSGCISGDDGGVIQSFDKSTVLIETSNFSDSYSSGFGGAIAAYGGSVHVFDSIFSDTYASRGGGAIWSSAYQSCYGFRQDHNTTLEIESSTFTNCTTQGKGGAILVSSDTSKLDIGNEHLYVTIHSSSFTSCQSSGYGGAFSFSGYNVVAELINSVISLSNSTFSGGAIYANNGVSLTLDGLVMRANTASVCGGAISVENEVSLALNGSVMLENVAWECGGAISASNRALLTLDRSDIHLNTAFHCGGAISANYSETVLINSKLNNNSALGLGGGALFLKETVLVANGTSCSGNTAPAGGGGVLLTQGSAAQSFEIIAGLCNQDNFAVYGPCMASECKSLNLTLRSSGFAGLPFKLDVAKLDEYKQVILTDNSLIQLLPSSSNLTALEDQSALFLIVGSSFSKCVRGSAFFEVAIKPSFVEISADKGVARVLSQPHIFVQSPDMLTGAVVKSDLVVIQMEEGGNVCPPGYILGLDLQVTGLNLPASGACKICQRGTYSLDPLLGKTNQIPSCFNCPTGLGSACLEDGSILNAIGNWTPVNGLLHLIHCPEGHQLINSSDGTSTGQFSHDNQGCIECNKLTQYILNPDRDVCQRCPAGLDCFGSDLVQAKITGSIWRRNGSIYLLESCPVGYSVSSLGVSRAFDATVQQCSPCLKGEECVSAPCTICSPCEAGFYKSTISPDPCSFCPINSFSEVSGGQALSSCTACPKNAGTMGKIGQSRFSSCICMEGFYMDPISPRDAKLCLVCPPGASCLKGQPPLFGTSVSFSLSLSGVTAFDLCCSPFKETLIVKGLAQSLDIDESAIFLSTSVCQDQTQAESMCSSTGRRLMSGILLTITTVTGNQSALISALTNADFLTGFATLANVSVGSLSVQNTLNIEKESGWVYGPMDSSGQFPLIKCNPGFLLINDSISTQTCFECAAGKYSVDFLDGCRGLSSCSSGRSCNKCPIGASCSGRNDFTKLLDTSVWGAVYDPISLTTIMKLISCPEGALQSIKYRRNSTFKLI